MVDKVKVQEGPRSFDKTTQGFIELFHKKRDGFPLEGWIRKRPSKPIKEMGYWEARNLEFDVQNAIYYQYYLTEVLNKAVKAYETGSIPEKNYSAPQRMQNVQDVINMELGMLKGELAGHREKKGAKKKELTEAYEKASAESLRYYNYSEKRDEFKAEMKRIREELAPIKNEDYSLRGKISMVSAYADRVCAPSGHIVTDYAAFKKRVDAENGILAEFRKFREELLSRMKEVNPINQ
ncbi:Uncharacterised protein [uncultured archaeon]|nr:Uncharacterised protein [uncultured archaeon]